MSKKVVDPLGDLYTEQTIRTQKSYQHYQYRLTVHLQTYYAQVVLSQTIILYISALSDEALEVTFLLSINSK
jgi:hypothetical protein